MQRESAGYPVDALPTRDDHVRTVDGWTLSVTITDPGLGAHGAMVIYSALGVSRQSYATLARTLCLTGRRVVMFDYRGIGEAAVTGPGTPHLADWGQYDIDAVLKQVHDMLVLRGCNGRKLTVLGHNTGRQLAGLAPYIVHADTLMRMAVSLADAWL